jgi:hypothetical protein
MAFLTIERGGRHARSLLVGFSVCLRGFRARAFPALTAVPASLLDGKEEVPGSSPGEGLSICGLSWWQDAACQS